MERKKTNTIVQNVCKDYNDSTCADKTNGSTLQNTYLSVVTPQWRTLLLVRLSFARIMPERQLLLWLFLSLHLLMQCLLVLKALLWSRQVLQFSASRSPFSM